MSDDTLELGPVEVLKIVPLVTDIVRRCALLPSL